MFFCIAGGLDEADQQEYIDAGTFTISKIRDYRSSYVEIMNLRMSVKDEVLFSWLRDNDVPAHVIQKIQDAFADFDTVRSRVTPYP
eukprot:8726539-Pyramimonas_sp.AAC.1